MMLKICEEGFLFLRLLFGLLILLVGDAREYPGGLQRLGPAFAYAEPPSS